MRPWHGLAFATLLIATPANAAPVSLQCRIVGPRAAIYGPLAVIVDIEARHIQIEARKMPGVRWEYRDGQTAPLKPRGQPSDEITNPPVEQFVRLTPSSVMFGWRWSDGDLGQVSTFNRSALRGRACRWRSAFESKLS